MEKRLFLAVFLSLVVVFGFQTVFGSKQKAAVNTQAAAVEQVPENKAVNDNSAVASSAKELVSDSVNYEVKTVKLENPIYDVSISNRGASIDSLYLKSYKYELPLNDLVAINLIKNKQFELKKNSDTSISAVYKDADWTVVKDIQLDTNYFINIKYSIINNTSSSKKFDSNMISYTTDLSRVDKSVVQTDATLFEYSIKTTNKIIRRDNVTKTDEKWNKEEVAKIEWIGFRDRYFAAIVEPKEQSKDFFVKNIVSGKLVLGSTLSEIIDPGASKIIEYKVYVGPQKLDVLEKAGEKFTSLMVFSNWGWLDAISKAMYWLLGMLHNLIPSWGLCIIAISLIVYGIMYPLTAKSLVSMKKLQALQPQMKEIQEKYKNNPERLNKEVVELYRVNQVNPLGGCLPMLLQMPIFVGLYQVLWRSVYFRGQSFLWMKDLSLPDQTIKLSFTIPFLGEYVNILPILMVGIMAVQQNLNMKSMAATTPDQASQQKMMAVVFPILIGFIFYNMASGLNLYFVIFYLLSTLTQWKISSSVK